jgi:cytochrome c oxidase subunit IV
MSTADTTAADPSAHDAAHAETEEHGDGHYADVQYIVVAFILAVVTAIEVLVTYVDIGPLFLPTLLVLMSIKFLTIVQLFMHLKFDSKIFSWLFFAGLLLALGVYIAMIAMFHMFTG